MKINFKNATLLDLDGNPVLDGNGDPIALNKTLANVLMRDAHKDTGINYADAVTWAIAINKGEEIDLEKSEQVALKKFIENAVEINAMTKFCLVKELPKIKE